MSEITTKRSVEVSVKQLRCDKCGTIVDNGPATATGWVCCHVMQQQLPSIFGPVTAPSLESALAYVQALPAALADTRIEQHLCVSCAELFTAFVKDAPTPAATKPVIELDKAEAALVTRDLFAGLALMAGAIAKVTGQPAPDLSTLLTPEGLDTLGSPGQRLAELVRGTVGAA